MPLRSAVLALAALLLLTAAQAHAAGPNSGPTEPIPELDGAAIPERLVGSPLLAVRVVNEAGRWAQRERLTRIRIGEPVTAELTRRAMNELLETGRYAAANARIIERASGIELELAVVPRRVAKEVQVRGSSFESDEVLRAAELQEGDELTPQGLRDIETRVRTWLGQRGYRAATVSLSTFDTNDPLRVVVRMNVEQHAPTLLAQQRFSIRPYPPLAALRTLLSDYAISAGARADESKISEADAKFAEELRSAGWFEAEVTHELVANGSDLNTILATGPYFQLRFEGNRRFDSAALENALSLDAKSDLSPSLLIDRLTDFYNKRGFLDAQIGLTQGLDASRTTRTLRFTIREGEVVRVTQRFYPCLVGPRDPSEVDSEVESFLEEELPGPAFFGTVDANTVDSIFSPSSPARRRPVPFIPRPYETYVPDVYERATEHIQELYRSEGWLSATVDPPILNRQACALGSPPGVCTSRGSSKAPAIRCDYDEYGVPSAVHDAKAPRTCDSGAGSGRTCSPEASLYIPVRLGPRTILYDLDFVGNEALLDLTLLETADVELGEPVSLAALETARRRIQAAYEEEGFYFVAVDYNLELSPDHSRGRATFDIRERERVIVSKIIIKGARRTNERLIRGRLALTEGEPYRRSSIRATEERLATLGVFSSITVALEDPHVPAREKVVVVSLVERPSQYLDVRPGFSTGEGIRVAFEYGHRNLASEAVALTFRVQLGYLPSALILEDDVRKKYDELQDSERLERRNSLRLEFPEIGLGPLFPFSIEGVDVRDNARDFGLTKDAGVLTLSFRPSRRFSIQLGASIERNAATIFGTDATTERAIATYIAAHPNRRNSFRVPEGTSAAFAQRIGFTLDRRDNPLDATSGTFASTAVEHVRAIPISDTETGIGANESLSDPFALTTSDFLRLTQRLAGYLRLNSKGMAIAASFSWGRNIQLPIEGSRTYPDRLFFLGGAASLRGFLQDSLVPEDVAQQLLDRNSDLTLNEVVIRGGDFYVNPRTELRIPLGDVIQTAIFMDAGNLWANLVDQNFWRLRYAVGSGLRIATPVGPLAFDYGFNVERVLDTMFPNRVNQRTWESLGAFHFSIGLF